MKFYLIISRLVSFEINNADTFTPQNSKRNIFLNKLSIFRESNSSIFIPKLISLVDDVNLHCCPAVSPTCTYPLNRCVATLSDDLQNTWHNFSFAVRFSRKFVFISILTLLSCTK